MSSPYRPTILKTSAISLATLASAVIIWLPRSAAAQDASSVDVAKTPMQLVCVTDTWAVWKTMQLIEKTRGHRAESFVHTYYRQRLSQPKASLAATVNETRVGFVTSIMRDGTLVLSHRDRLSLYSLEGGVKEYRQLLFVVAAYPDGILLQDVTGLDPKPVFFVPFRDHELDMHNKVEVVPAAVLPDRHSDDYVAMTYAWKKVPYRHGNILAWISDSVLHCYDLRDGKRSRKYLHPPTPPRKRVDLYRAWLHSSQQVQAFDGETVIVYRFAFDAKTGRVVYEDPEHPPFLYSAFALHDRFAYFFHDGHLMAADLAAPTSQKTLVAVKQSQAAETDKGLVVWDGKKWTTVPWLERPKRD